METNSTVNKVILTVGIIATSTMPTYNSVVTNDKRNNVITINNSTNNTTRLLKNNDSFNLDKLKSNKQRLNSFKSFSKNWNNYDADSIAENVYDIVNNLLTKLTIQPQIFPTGRGSIQIEKYFDTENFYEIEIGKDEIYAYIVKGENEFEDSIEEKDIIPLISKFYA